MLPLVRVIVRDLVEAHRALAERIDGFEKARMSDPVGFDSEAAERQIEDAHRAFDVLLRELGQLGVVCRDASRGLVEFPALFGVITWEPGEAAVRVG